MCVICQDCNYGRAIKSPCGHSYHYGCLKKAITHNRTCPLCRATLPWDWLRRQNLVKSSRQYWAEVEKQLLPVPVIGPLVPSQQRRYNLSIGEINQLPPWWSRQWICDRLVELRIRYNIPSEIELTSQDLRRCEDNSIIGMRPEWTFPTWVQYVDSEDDTENIDTR